MEFKKKTIIWEDNNEPPKNYIWAKADGKFYEYGVNGWKLSKNIKTNLAENLEAVISDMIIKRFSSDGFEKNFTLYSKQKWEELINIRNHSNLITEEKGDTSNSYIVGFFDGESDKLSINLTGYYINEQFFNKLKSLVLEFTKNNNTFGGLYISKGVLCYDNNEFSIAEDYEKSNSKYYFQASQIKNVSIDKWRVPSRSEWETILNSRTGATIKLTYSNTTYNNARFSIVKLDTDYGILLFPDDKEIISSREFSKINQSTVSSYMATQIDSQTLTFLLNQGCAFISGLGCGVVQGVSVNYTNLNECMYLTSDNYYFLYSGGSIQFNAVDYKLYPAKLVKESHLFINV